MKYVIYCIAGLVFIYLVLPIFVIIPMSFNTGQYLVFPPEGFTLKWYGSIFNDSNWAMGIRNSLIVAIATTIISTIFGTVTSIGLNNIDSKIKNMVFGFLMLPVVVPLIITAIALYSIFNFLGITGSLTALIMAHSLISIPYVLATTLSALKGFDRNLEHAAYSLGANRFTTFFRIILPIILPGVLSGAIFAFMTSFDEIVIALFVSGVNTKTLPIIMWNSIRLEISPSLAAVASLIILLTIAVLVSAIVSQTINKRYVRSELVK